MGEKGVRIALVVVDLFAALSAIVGAVGLIVGYIEIPLSVLQGTPFTDFTVPALLLGIVVGGSALAAAAIALFGPRRIAPLASAVAGCIMVGWMTVEIAMIGLAIWVQAAYFVVGLLMIGLAVWLELLQRAELHQASVSGQHHVAA
ncbi:MAG: hypothetical protein ACXVDA_15680 [Ktedonobacterales bacterium]